MYSLSCWCFHNTPSFFRHKVWTEKKKKRISTLIWNQTNPHKLPKIPRRPHQLREHIPFPKLTILRDKRPPHPQLILRSATSGTSRDLREKRRRKKSVSISLLTSGAEGDFRWLRYLMKDWKYWYFFFPRLGTSTCFEVSSYAFE